MKLFVLMSLCLLLSCNLTNMRSETLEKEEQNVTDKSFQLLQFTPQENQYSVVLDTAISLQFNRSVNAETVTVNSEDTICKGSIQLSYTNFLDCLPLKAALEWSEDKKTVTVYSSAMLAENTIYKVRALNTIADTAGNLLTSNYQMNNGFSTIGDTTPPTVSSAGLLSSSVSAPVVITFSEKMDSETITANLTDTTCSGNIQLSCDSFSNCIKFQEEASFDEARVKFTLKPAADLPYNTTCTLKILTAVKDVSNNQLELEKITSFKTPGYLLTGVITYDRVPVSSGSKLDFENTQILPVRKVNLSLLNDSGSVVKSSTTDENGAYSFEITADGAYRVRAYAQTSSPSIAIRDNTDDYGATYYGQSVQVMELDGPKEHNLHFPSGWAGTNANGAYTNPRMAAPFAILDFLYGVETRILSYRDDLYFPALNVYWSDKNLPLTGDIVEGQIGSTHWDGEKLYVLGKADVDTDEYDQAVLGHEWMRYFLDSFSRSDLTSSSSFGVFSSAPDIAFEQGLLLGFASWLTEADYYRDTLSLKQQHGQAINLTQTSLGPGWANGGMIAQLLGQLIELEGVGVAPLLDVLVDSLATTPICNTIFSFLFYLKHHADIGDTEVASINNLGEQFAISEVTDVYGTTETHFDQLLDWILPPFVIMSAGETQKVTLNGVDEQQRLLNSRYIVFTGNGQTLDIKATASNDVDFYLYHEGILVAYANNSGLTEQLTVATTDGVPYLLQIKGPAEIVDLYEVELTLANASTKTILKKAITVPNLSKSKLKAPVKVADYQVGKQDIEITLQADLIGSEVTAIVYGVDGATVSGYRVGDEAEWTAVIDNNGTISIGALDDQSTLHLCYTHPGSKSYVILYLKGKFAQIYQGRVEVIPVGGI